MPKGVIKFFNESKGYGFIETEATPGHSRTTGVYVHHSQIAEAGYRTLREGEAVVFDVREGCRGLEAVNVQRKS
jgi:CspA family cold shock protein